jgi:hypothetical protein
MRGVEDFLRTIERRETTILDQIFVGKKNPFEVGL